MYPRHLTTNLLAALADTPVVMLHGARQSGKSTLARELARGEKWPARYLNLDDLNTVAAARSDPVGFLAKLDGPAVIDEVQRAPELFLAIKSEVDRRRRPGRFLLTGSAHLLTLPRLADALVGRMEVQTLWPLSQGEVEGRREKFIDLMFGKGPSAFAEIGPADQGDLVKRMLRGGFPEILARVKAERRRAWFESYLSVIVQREVGELSQVEGLAEFPRLLAVLAARAGGMINYADLARDSAINQVTLKRYLSLLEATFLIRRVPPWFSNRIKSVVKSPKLYFCDPGVLAHLLDLTPGRLRRNPTSEGALLENFVALELIKQSAWSKTRPALFHFRTYAGQEVDFLLEAPGARSYVAIEVKASATVRSADFKGLGLVADALGDRFRRGAVLYTGTSIVPFAKNLFAIPVSALWRL